MKELLDKYATKDAVLWVVGFTGVCVLVGLGKLKPETVEYMLFALVGRASTQSKAKP